MAVGTLIVQVDLNNDLSTETDISAYVQGTLALDGLGITGQSDMASPARLQLELDNRDGRFTPGNSGSPYYPDFAPGIYITATALFNSVSYSLLSGYISEIAVLPEPKDQRVRLTCIDPLFVLTQQETKLPLMVEQYTGVIIERLCDYAERGEMCENDRFVADLTDWSIAAGTGTITRSTERGVPLHRPAAAIVENLSQPTGQVRYTLPDNHAGESVKASFYVRALTQADAGGLMRARLRDDTGIAVSGSPFALAYDKWTKVTVSGAAYDAGATECYATLERISGSYAANFIIGALHIVPVETRFQRGPAAGTSLDDGQGIIDYIAYSRSVNAIQAIQEVARNELGGLFFFGDGGNAWYYDRAHRWNTTESTTSQYTFTERLDLQYSESLDDRISGVRLYYPEPDVGEAGTVVYTLNPVPMRIPASGTLDLDFDFGGALIQDIIEPVVNTDYTINSKSDGTGSDDTGSVTIAFTEFGAGALVTVTSGLSRDTWLTLFRVRGTPIRMPTDRLVESTPTNLIPLNNPLVYTYGLQTRQGHIKPWAQYLSGKYGDTQQSRIKATATAPWPQCPTSGTDITAVLGLTIGDRITVTNTAFDWATQVSGDFWVEGLSRSIQDGMCSLTTNLVPVDDDYFLIDTDAVDGAALIAP